MFGFLLWIPLFHQNMGAAERTILFWASFFFCFFSLGSGHGGSNHWLARFAGCASDRVGTVGCPDSGGEGGGKNLACVMRFSLPNSPFSTCLCVSRWGRCPIAFWVTSAMWWCMYVCVFLRLFIFIFLSSVYFFFFFFCYRFNSIFFISLIFFWEGGASGYSLDRRGFQLSNISRVQAGYPYHFTCLNKKKPPPIFSPIHLWSFVDGLFEFMITWTTLDSLSTQAPGLFLKCCVRLRSFISETICRLPRISLHRAQPSIIAWQFFFFLLFFFSAQGPSFFSIMSHDARSTI